MKKFFNILSGKPKSGDIVECIKPFIFFPQLIICVGTIYIGFLTDEIFYAVLGAILAWQAGWGMSIVRFYNNETKEK